ncbi:hypothetical protein TGMAS_413810, partial [Toxoplasma gondii MAS]
SRRSRRPASRPRKRRRRRRRREMEAHTAPTSTTSEGKTRRQTRLGGKQDWRRRRQDAEETPGSRRRERGRERARRRASRYLRVARSSRSAEGRREERRASGRQKRRKKTMGEQRRRSGDQGEESERRNGDWREERRNEEKNERSEERNRKREENDEKRLCPIQMERRQHEGKRRRKKKPQRTRKPQREKTTRAKKMQQKRKLRGPRRREHERVRLVYVVHLNEERGKKRKTKVTDEETTSEEKPDAGLSQATEAFSTYARRAERGRTRSACRDTNRLSCMSATRSKGNKPRLSESDMKRRERKSGDPRG